MAKTSLYIFVEGHMDRCIYDQMLDSVCKEKKMAYEIVLASDIEGLSGGKKGLLDFFDYLRKNGSLVDSFEEKKTVSLFYMDKDVDDFKRSQKKSEHIIYTELYEIENYLFKYGELISSVATACSLSRLEVRLHLKGGEEWRRKAANTWRDWVCLCAFSCVHNIICSGNYRMRKSPVNSNRGYGATDKVLYKEYLQQLKRKSALNNEQFTGILDDMIKKIVRNYEKDEHDRVFKGARYFDHLKKDMQKIEINTQYDNKDLDGKVRVALIHTLDFDGKWTEHFKAPLRRMISKEKI